MCPGIASLRTPWIRPCRLGFRIPAKDTSSNQFPSTHLFPIEASFFCVCLCRWFEKTQKRTNIPEKGKIRKRQIIVLACQCIVITNRLTNS